MKVKESRQQGDRQQAQLVRERSRNMELQTQLGEMGRSKDHEITQLSSRLLESQEKLKSHDKDRY